MFISAITASFNFLRENWIKIAVFLGALLAYGFLFYVSTATLKKLKVQVFRYYPFDQFLPRSGSWSVGYFLTMAVFLALLIYFLLKGEFYLPLGPA